ncbi:MAG: HNH endonuclease [Kiritimatiellae bacterium]|nr:HNH endonuclease [Kiritimatiellia bacterium]
MNILSDFTNFINETNTPGSNKAGSYVRALKYLNVMLRECSPDWKDLGDIFEVESIATLKKLHRLALDEGVNGEACIFAQADVPPSYLKNRFCAGALRALIGYRLALEQDTEMGNRLASTTDPLVVAKTIEQAPLPEPKFFLEGNVNPQSKEGKAALSRNLEVRNRRFFTRLVLSNFDNACCLTGLDVPATLRACLIVSEDKKKAFSPDNALCLSATYAAAFKEHLISFDEDNRMILSPALREHATSEIFHHTFKTYEGAHMRTALRFQPSARLLAMHREKLAS